MWLWYFTTSAILLVDAVQSDVGLSSTSFSNELRSGFTRLFQNGVEQPVQQPQYVLVNPVADFQNTNNRLLQRPAPFNSLGSSGYPQQTFRPRYAIQHLSWVIPYYYVPTRYYPSRGNKRPNDVLVVVVKTNSNCTGSTNTTKPGVPADDDDNIDDDDDDDGNEVTVIL